MIWEDDCFSGQTCDTSPLYGQLMAKNVIKKQLHCAEYPPSANQIIESVSTIQTEKSDVFEVGLRLHGKVILSID